VPGQSGFIDQPKLGGTDASGNLKCSGLAPGDYRVAAWEQFDSGIGMAPEFLSKFKSKAAKVKLSESIARDGGCTSGRARCDGSRGGGAALSYFGNAFGKAQLKLSARSVLPLPFH
jgi:hypothetical protein